MCCALLSIPHIGMTKGSKNETNKDHLWVKTVTAIRMSKTLTNIFALKSLPLQICDQSDHVKFPIRLKKILLQNVRVRMCVYISKSACMNVCVCGWWTEPEIVLWIINFVQKMKKKVFCLSRIFFQHSRISARRDSDTPLTDELCLQILCPLKHNRIGYKSILSEKKVKRIFLIWFNLDFKFFVDK
jgi:hypothetical protein